MSKLPYSYPSFLTQTTLFGLAQEVLKMFQRIARVWNEPDHGTTAERPAFDLTTGQFYFDDTLNAPIWWDNDALAWVVGTTGAVPVGGNPTAQVGPAAINGVAVTFMRSDAAPKLADTAVAPGAYTYAALTVDQQGRLTAAASGAAPPAAANPTATVSGSAVNGVAATFMRSDAAPALANTTVTAGSYTNTDLTVDAQGRITAAANGSGGSGSPGGSANDVQYNNAGAFGGLTLNDGQLLIGDTGGVPVPATLTAGAGIEITNAAGAITLESAFGAAENTVDTASTSLFATKGGLFTPAVDLLVRGVYFQVDEVNTGVYKAGIYALDGSFAITALTAVSATYTAVATATALRVFMFSSVVTLSAGTLYAVAHTRTDATSTTSSGAYATPAGVGGYHRAVPATKQNTRARLTSVNPAVGNTFDTGATAFYSGLIYAIP